MRRLIERIRRLRARRRAMREARRAVRAAQKRGGEITAQTGYTAPPEWQSYMANFDETVMTYLRNTAPDHLNADFFDCDIEINFRSTEASGEEQRARHLDDIERRKRERAAALIACRRKMSVTQAMLTRSNARLSTLRETLEREDSFDFNVGADAAEVRTESTDLNGDNTKVQTEGYDLGGYAAAQTEGTNLSGYAAAVQSEGSGLSTVA